MLLLLFIWLPKSIKKNILVVLILIILCSISCKSTNGDFEANAP
ncbi:hypothetical protein RchiOBHm_Chr6g0289761 [Rosa chinensis]|uniref:Uncharacterized protein n=1 Tax=Rosa chinensis TaxID=74649 RepID=A0A2P6PVR7_ROSCH|nr:hypothetical protein RchiOBHm_Chr6g0289761 [Rosa chinensis]